MLKFFILFSLLKTFIARKVLHVLTSDKSMSIELSSLGDFLNKMKCCALLQYNSKIRVSKRDKQILLNGSGNIRRNNAQNDPNSPKRAINAEESNRPGHDIEDLIVFPGCLEGENCHDTKCKSVNYFCYYFIQDIQVNLMVAYSNHPFHII